MLSNLVGAGRDAVSDWKNAVTQYQASRSTETKEEEEETLSTGMRTISFEPSADLYWYASWLRT